MADYQFLGAEIEKPGAEGRWAVKKRYLELLALAFAGAGLLVMLTGLPAMVGYLLWATGVAAWMYVKTV